MTDKNFMESLAKSIEEEKKDKKSENIPKIVKKEEAFEEKAKETKVKPDSFNQEKFEKIKKEKRIINLKALIPSLILLLACLAGIYFLFFSPKIVMGDFVGKNVSEFSSWASQNKIVKSGIAIKHEYSFEYDKDFVIEQSIPAGKKIYNNSLINVTLSNGPDPDENIKFPDIKNMDLDEINEWIKTNKLTKTKVVTQYNDNVAENSVISFDLKNVNENNFTRGSTLNINVSKGKAPAGQVAVEDFTNKNFDEMLSWAKNKKVELVKEESYSDKLQVGYIISQSIVNGNTIKEGEKITVVVSKGKAVKIPNLVGYTKTMLEAWSANKDNNVTVVKKEIYSNEPFGNVISQSLPANSSVDQGSVLELTISSYLPVVQTNSRQWYGKDYQELIAWVDGVNYKGANIHAGAWMGTVDYDDDAYKVPGSIIEYKCVDVNGNDLVYTGSEGTNACGRPLPLNAKISMKISSGRPSQNYINSHQDKSEVNPPVETSSLEKPSVVGNMIQSSSTTKIKVKSTPNANITIKSVGENGEELGKGKIYNDGYAEIEVKSLPDVIIVIAELNGETQQSEITTQKQ